ncbi:unnamed protein product [Prorocentrum cordatum]|uniref:PUM-HD domain-containing protein n=2 Tax=Prorocentrum cordatum TaxID=2364126 RepID=A0ABN9RJS2_9DINO|nr:unnamed protein product [Polarella glacialis]
MAGDLGGYEGELASNILLDDCDGGPAGVLPAPFAGYHVQDPSMAAAGPAGSRQSGRPSGSPKGGSRAHGRAPNRSPDGKAPHRSPARTPSPVGVYQWGHSQEGPWAAAAGRHSAGGKGGSSMGGGLDPAQAYGMGSYGTVADSPMFPFPWPGPDASYGMMATGSGGLGGGVGPRADALGGEGHGEGGGLGDDDLMMDPRLWQQQMMMAAAMQANCMGGVAAAEAQALSAGEAPDHGAGWAGDARRARPRGKDRPSADPGSGAGASPWARGPGEDKGGAGGKGGRRRGGGGVGGAAGGGEERHGGGGHGGGGKSRPPSNPVVEQLKARHAQGNIDLGSLASHIGEIATDQYGSRLIQQKLEVASDEEKQQAFAAVLQHMSMLTQDVFGNYVIQKFFEHGTPEQRRMLAEQLLGQVLQLSLQMYGCRVVQKALDWVPIEQQVLLIGELKGHVLPCIEDQHGNHVIQKCIERLPTDRIGFIVDSFRDQACRMAKHCYGCRVIQRLIEFCASHQISALLDEVLQSCMDLAEDQYGNYVVQHVMEHSSRPGDRQSIMLKVCENILKLSCHKYASNVIEKALSCGTIDERSAIIYAIVGEQGSTHSPLVTMMSHRFGNYIVQRAIQLSAGPQRNALFWKLHNEMPTLKKSNTYGKHIISALEEAQNPRVAAVPKANSAGRPSPTRA